MKITFEKINPKAIIPVRHHEHDAGFDFFTLSDVTIPAAQRALVSTGLRCKIDNENYFMMIKDKSSMALKGIHTFAGVVDNNYRGEIKIVLYNSNSHDVQLKAGQKIAQGIVLPVEYAEIEEGEVDVEETSRGEGGFGSTGEGAELD